MAEYWLKCFGDAIQTENWVNPATNHQHHHRHHHHDDDDFDQAWKGHLKATMQGWEGELKQYIKEPLCDMKKKMDTLKWWSVSVISMSSIRALISRIYHGRCIQQGDDID